MWIFFSSWSLAALWLCSYCLEVPAVVTWCYINKTELRIITRLCQKLMCLSCMYMQTPTQSPHPALFLSLYVLCLHYVFIKSLWWCYSGGQCYSCAASLIIRGLQSGTLWHCRGSLQKAHVKHPSLLLPLSDGPSLCCLCGFAHRRVDSSSIFIYVSSTESHHDHSQEVMEEHSCRRLLFQVIPKQLRQR